jgi:hypothetical protein
MLFDRRSDRGLQSADGRDDDGGTRHDQPHYGSFVDDRNRTVRLNRDERRCLRSDARRLRAGA